MATKSYNAKGLIAVALQVAQATAISLIDVVNSDDSVASKT